MVIKFPVNGPVRYFVIPAGIEPATPWLKARCATNCATKSNLLYPRPESNRHPFRDHILSVARLPVSPRGYCGRFTFHNVNPPVKDSSDFLFLARFPGCCAATIRTWNTSAKNLGVTITPRRNHNAKLSIFF